MATVSGRRRILCSLQELRNLKGRALKFPLHPRPFNHSERKGEEQTTIKSRRRHDELLTGFVFLNEDTQQPHAFINRCPHALLELDFDDSDFFCEGFIHCKAHAAFFDPSTGICLKGPTSSRTCLRGLDKLRVELDSDKIVLLTTPSSPPKHVPEVYKREKQHQLAQALAKRSERWEVREMQQQLHEKTMARLKQYELVDRLDRK